MTSSSDNEFQRRRLFVHGIPPKSSNASIATFFASFGPVTAVHNSKHGYAFVTFEEEDAAIKALGANGDVFQGKVLSVRRKKGGRSRKKTTLLELSSPSSPSRVSRSNSAIPVAIHRSPCPARGGWFSSPSPSASGAEMAAAPSGTGAPLPAHPCPPPPPPPACPRTAPLSLFRASDLTTCSSSSSNSSNSTSTSTTSRVTSQGR